MTLSVSDRTLAADKLCFIFHHCWSSEGAGQWNNGKAEGGSQITSYSFDHIWTSNTVFPTMPDRLSNIIPTWWLVSWDLMWPIGEELVTTITFASCWGTHFLYLSNTPSGNLLPIIPWVDISFSRRFLSQNFEEVWFSISLTDGVPKIDDNSLNTNW